jgi:cysteine desulfurase
MTPIYLDHNATAPLDPAVLDAMMPYLTRGVGNPSSPHRAGRAARHAVESAREAIAHFLDAHPDEVTFTSGATEANNLALYSLAGEQPCVLAHSGIEHPSAAEPLAHLEKQGYTLVSLRAASGGPSEARGFSRACVQLANHETGEVLPVADIAAVAPTHCDATQAVGKMPVSFHGLGVASLAFSGHKIHGPQGIGALLLRRGATLRPMLRGGGQQRGLRPGTEPAALIVGLAAAVTLAVSHLEENVARLRLLRQAFWDGLRDAGPVLSSPEDGLPHVLNVSFPGLKSDALVIALDLAGVACSAGAACASGSLLPSPVLRAMGLPEAQVRSSVRFSLGRHQTAEEVREAAARICQCVKKMRQEPPRGGPSGRIISGAARDL